MRNLDNALLNAKGKSNIQPTKVIYTENPTIKKGFSDRYKAKVNMDKTIDVRYNYPSDFLKFVEGVDKVIYDNDAIAFNSGLTYI